MAKREHYLNLKPWQVKAALDGRLAAVWVRMRKQPEHGMRLYKTGRMKAPAWGRLAGPNTTAVLDDKTRCPLGVPGDVIVCKKHGITLTNAGVEVRRARELADPEAFATGLFSNGFAAGVCHVHNREGCRRCGWEQYVTFSHGRACWDDNDYGWLVKVTVQVK